MSICESEIGTERGYEGVKMVKSGKRVQVDETIMVRMNVRYPKK